MQEIEKNLHELPPDHPGFADPAYRARRDKIARLAKRAAAFPDAARVDYTPEENALWAGLWREFVPLNARTACRPLREAAPVVDLQPDRIPQLDEVTAALAPVTGFKMQPVAGLVPSREFFAALGEGVFLSTQYIRHAARPHYTPEPDIVHELVGHAASLAVPEIAELNRAFGKACASADESRLAALESVYWFTLEFGLVDEGGELKALGAGLLSSVAELRRAVEPGPQLVPLREWDLARIAVTPFRTDGMQPHYFVAPSFEYLVRSTMAWLEKE